MNRIALAVLVLVLGITTAAEAQEKKRGDEASAPKKTQPTASVHTLRWDRDAAGQWVIGPASRR